MKIRVPPARTLLAARLFEVEFRQRRVVGTGAGDQHVVDRRGQLVEEPPEPFEVGGVEGRGTLRIELAGGALERLGVSGNEDDVCSLSARSSGRFESDAGATADYDDGLPEQFRFAPDGRASGCGTHDSSDQQSKIAFTLRHNVRYFLRRNAFRKFDFQHDTAFGVNKHRHTCKVWFLVFKVRSG
jgi:hypothetical protein